MGISKLLVLGKQRMKQQILDTCTALHRQVGWRVPSLKAKWVGRRGEPGSRKPGTPGYRYSPDSLARNSRSYASLALFISFSLCSADKHPHMPSMMPFSLSLAKPCVCSPTLSY